MLYASLRKVISSSEGDWNYLKEARVFWIFLIISLLLGDSIVIFNLYVDYRLHSEEAIYASPFLIGSLAIFINHQKTRLYVYSILSISFLFLNIGYIFINTDSTLRDPKSIDELTIIYSIIYFTANSALFKKRISQVLNLFIYATSSFILIRYLFFAPIFLVYKSNTIKLIDIWLLSTAVLTTQYFSNYVRESSFRQLVEARQKVNELEIHRDLLNENSRIRDELARISRISTLEAMATMISHETNQPIGSALTYAEAARRWLNRRRPNNAEAKSAIEGVIAQVTRAGDIIASVRRMTARNVEKAREIDLIGVFDALTPLIRSYTESHGITLEFNVQTSIGPVTAVVREPEINQVIINLVQNSIESFDKLQNNKIITISIMIREIGWIDIAVQDNGQGIHADDVSAIFDSFYTTKDGGTGLGLSICREIAEIHGGSLFVESEIGRGTTITLRIPRTAA
jgi:signal transduction histidine kinase